MWDMHIFNIKFITVFYNFFIYAFLGWIYESVYVSIVKRNWVNRGFLNGPVIPLYGAGATLIYMVFWQYRENLFLIFAGGMLLATVLEYLTSLVMELIFHAKWWDYSDMKYNYHGRICLGVSVFWGILSVLVIELLQPHVLKLMEFIPERQGEYIGYLIFTLLLGDLTFTVVHTVQLNSMLADLQRIKQEFSDYIESTKLYGTREEWKIKLSNFKISDLLENIKLSIEENKEKLIELNRNREGFEIKKFRADIERHVKDYLCKFHSRTGMTSLVQKRLLKAFPNVRFIKREDALKDLKERLLKYRKK